MALFRCIFVGLLCATIAANPAVRSSSGAVVRKPSAATADSSDVSSELRQIVVAGQLSDLRWPDFSDYRVHLKNFYEPSGYTFAWIRDSQATPQAQVVIDTLQQADGKGLNAEDYDSSRWKARLGQLNEPAGAAHFDVALTVCVMRYISDLHIGKVNPQHFKFGLSTGGKKYDLPQFVRSRLVSGTETKAALESIEPPFAGYKRTQAALQHYMELSHEDDGEQLPVLAKSINPGDEYIGVPRLTRLLRLLGDLPASANAPPGNVYQSPLVEAVKHFQERHGLIPNGSLDAQTLKQLNAPLSSRVEQLRLTLERWRWLPLEFAQPPVVVNIPEFHLRTFDASGHVVLNMRVIVGKAYRHQTPVFEKEMQYVVFRPYWNVPPSIQRSEIVPAIQRDRNYEIGRASCRERVCLYV